ILSEAAISFMTRGKLLPGPQQDVIRDWKSLPGFTYGNLLRVMETPGQYLGLGVKGEYGWDGWLGAYFANDPVHKITILMGMQKIDAGTWALTRKVRNAAFGELI
ncbi:MAG: serine hydrolase, partial [Lachnospiraceae bacterium]|nr:serine hydrolase [Lachnospiraceae bacterium]